MNHWNPLEREVPDSRPRADPCFMWQAPDRALPTLASTTTAPGLCHVGLAEPSSGHRDDASDRRVFHWPAKVANALGRPAVVPLLLTLAIRAQAGLEITASPTPLAPPLQDPTVLVHHAQEDQGGNTSVRFVTNRKVKENAYPPVGVTVFTKAARTQPQRDRDLGQTFFTGDRPVRLDALFLRIGHGDAAVRSGAPHAAVAIQWFAVTGTPRLHDHGTPGFAGHFDRARSPELDDYLEGEQYFPLRVVQARLPASLQRGEYLKFDFTDEDEIVLEPRRTYAFLLMFLERAEDRSFTLANEYYGTYVPDPTNRFRGHAIRREGNPAFPVDWRHRLTQPPTTLGFPDVCTFRDLHFVVTVKPGHTHPAPSGDLMTDSPITFPKHGALPARFPPDLKTEHFDPGEPDYYLFRSPERSLAQIRAIRAAMPPGWFNPPPSDWRGLSRTRHLLTEGGRLQVMAIGDSIVNDTMRSGWITLLQEAYPRAEITATVYVRGGGGCQHFMENGRLAKHVIPLRPDLVFLGGISQRDLASVREVITQLRAALPEVEILLGTGAFGSVDPRNPEALQRGPCSGTGEYGRQLRQLAVAQDCAFLDFTTPWAEYLNSAGVHPHGFYRDAVHANEFGEQVLAQIIMSFFRPDREMAGP